MKTFAIAILAVSSALVAGDPACAQAFPQSGRTMRLIVPFAAGGGVDNAARLLAEELREQTGMTVIIENRSGASGTLGGRVVQTAAPDGYTLLFSASTHVFARDVLPNAPYDPITDFAPVAKFGEAPLLLVVAPQLGKTSLSDAMAAARAAPQPWSAALPAYGAASHLATLLLARQARLPLQYVAYKGTQPALMDVAGGHVQMQLDSMISLAPLAKTGRVIPIAISSDKRSSVLPQVPTFEEGGVSNVRYTSWYGVWAPKATPPDIIDKLNASVNQSASALARKGALDALGLYATPVTPTQFQSLIADEVRQGRELLRESGFKPE